MPCYREWRMETKENEEIRIIKDPDPAIMDKPIPKIRIKPKGKEMAKISKGKKREKASHESDTATGRKTTMKRTIKTMRQNQ